MTAQDTRAMRQGLNPYNVLVLCFLGLGSMTYGYTASIIGTTLGQPSFIKYFQLDTRPNGTDLIASTNGLFQTGGFLGTLCLPWFADKFGRRWACALAASLALLSGALMAGSVDIGMFLAFRFFAGAGAFMILAAVPILMNELVPGQFRGALVDIHGILLVLGYVIQGWVGFGFYFWTDGGKSTWRPPVAIQCFWPLCLLVALPWLPESPRWLCMQGRPQEAHDILIRLHANKNDPDHAMAEAEFLQINKQIEIDRTLGSSWVDMFRKPSYRKRAFLAIGTTGIIQCSGVLVINNYGPTLYKSLGFSPVKQLLYPAAWLLFALGMNVAGMFLVDRFNRPRYMAFGVAGCMATLVVEAALVASFPPATTKNSSALQACVAMFFVYQIFYGACLDGTQFSYLGELFPTHLRAKGVSLGVSVISLMNIIWLQSAPVAFENIGWRFYLCFIIPGSIGVAIMWIFFPDTRGLPLEEIAAIFGDEKDVALYQRDLDVDTSHTGNGDSEKPEVVHVTERINRRTT